MRPPGLGEELEDECEEEGEEEEEDGEAGEGGWVEGAGGEDRSRSTDLLVRGERSVARLTLAVGRGEGHLETDRVVCPSPTLDVSLTRLVQHSPQSPVTHPSQISCLHI